MTDNMITLEKIVASYSTIRKIASIPKFISNPHLTVLVEDWSDVRSPSRAARRRKQGHPQRIRTQVLPDPKFYTIGDIVAAHPETMRKFQDKISDRINSHFEDAIFGAFMGTRKP